MDKLFFPTTLVGKLSPNSSKNAFRGHCPSQHRGLTGSTAVQASRKRLGVTSVSEIATQTHLVSTHSTPSKMDTKNKEAAPRVVQLSVTQTLRRLRLKVGKPKARRNYKREF